MHLTDPALVGIFSWTSGDFTSHADNVNVVQSDNESLVAGAWVRQTADAVAYRYDDDSVAQSVADTIRRERLNVFDKIPKALWTDIEQGSNQVDLTEYFVAALESNRGINVPRGRFRMALDVNWENADLSLRGEGRNLTYFENVDNRPIVTLDSSTAALFGFELEDMWLENRDPALWTECDLLKLTGTAFQNDKHHFRRLWLFQGRDNIACYGRSIWSIFDDIQSTGALRDALHVETTDNVNQWSLRDAILRGAGRNGIFFKHDAEDAATGWTLQNVSTEACQFEGWRFTGSNGLQAFGVSQCTFEQNAIGIASGSSDVMDGIRRRKANVFLDTPYVMGLDFSTTTFYGDPCGNNPDWHIYTEAGGAVSQFGSVANCRLLATRAGGGAVSWPVGLTFHANNDTGGSPVITDPTVGGLDLREFVRWTEIVPNLAFGGTSTGMIFSNQRGLYRTLGRRVEFELYVSITSKGSATGPVTISLPRPAMTSATLPMTVAVSADGIGAAGQIVGRIEPGGSTVDLYRYDGGSLTALTDVDCGNFVAFSVSGSYVI